MRIACIYLPSLPLQVRLRGAPHLVGAPVAVVATPRPTAITDRVHGSGPVVVARSRAAAAAGVRLGTSALAARESVPGLIVTDGDRAAEAAAVRAVAEALGALTPRIDLGGDPGSHHALYAEVPARVRGATFGARVLEVLEAQGLRGRVGIADDRFTAWVAASWHAPSAHDAGEVVTVPRGGSAAFLAPLPLALLAISPEVQHVLGALGVRTLGEFAALPPPSTAHVWDADYQALARGDGGAGLEVFRPVGRIVERIELGGELGAAAALGLAVRRVAARLAGRGRAAAKVVVRAGEREVDVALDAPLADEADLGDAIGRALHEVGAAGFLEIAVDVHVEAGRPPMTVGTGAAAGDARAAVPTAVADVASGPVEVSFQLTAPASQAMVPRQPHRRTRRGKQRPRIGVAAQSRLFS
ncbi:MAG: hypothetical protein H6709_09845 [Kofleriaceae bacterium]|nr:hypothetical protein [Kofleriaceae bacterium]